MKRLAIVLVVLMAFVPTTGAQDDPRQRCLRDLAAQAAAQLEKVSKAPTLELALALLDDVQFDPTLCDDAGVFEAAALDYVIVEATLDGWREMMRQEQEVVPPEERQVLCLDEPPPVVQSSAMGLFLRDGSNLTLIDFVDVYPSVESAATYMALLARGLEECPRAQGFDITQPDLEFVPLGDETLSMAMSDGQFQYVAVIVRQGNLVRMMVIYTTDGSVPDAALLQSAIRRAVEETR